MDHFCFLCVCHTVLSVPFGKGLDILALLYVMFSCVLSLSHVEHWDRCGI